MQPGSFKLCPKCKLQAPLDAPVCVQCGHHFRTQFNPPPNQTQAFQAPQTVQQAPYVPSQPNMGQPMVAAPDGPRDRTEWNAAVGWLWFFAWLIGAVLYSWLRVIHTDAFMTLDLMLIVGLAALLTFVGMRIRRLYRFSPFSSGSGLTTLAIVGSLLLLWAVTIEIYRAQELTPKPPNNQNNEPREYRSEQEQMPDNAGYGSGSFDEPQRQGTGSYRPRRRGEIPH